MRWLALAFLVVPSLATAAPKKLTLEQVIAKAVANPRIEMVQGDRLAAQARVEEANAAQLPKFKATAFGTISPHITCDTPDCTRTSPQNFAWDFKGVMGGAQLDVTQPLYTFGKIAHAKAAAHAGADAQAALADEAAGDAAVDAARAYWGLKLARELGYQLDDAIEKIDHALAEFQERKDVTIQDRQRLAVLLAAAKSQRADAAQLEAQALSGLRAITGIPDADIDDEEIAAVEHALPNVLDTSKRPQSIAAKSGAVAATELTAFQRAYYFPDLALVGTAFISRAQGVTDPPSAFAYDPYNRTGGALVLALQWQVEPWTVRAKVDRARGEAHKMKAQADLAAIGATYDADTVLAEARAAKDKLAATDEGEKAAHTWLASVLQNEAVGTAEAKDLADAYIAWFQMKAAWAQAVFTWNVAVVRLGRVVGEFHAAPIVQR